MNLTDSEQHLGLGPAAVLQALKSSVRMLRGGLLLLAAVYLSSGITVVGPNETAFVLRFGKLQPAVHTSGLLLAFPQPIDEVVKVPTRSVQEIALDDWDSSAITGPTLDPVYDAYTLTGDANIIRAKFSVRYQISDPAAYVLSVTHPVPLLGDILYRAATVVIAQMNVDDVLASGLEALRSEAMRIAQNEIDRLGLGVKLLAFEVNSIEPARQVLPAFEDVVSARVESRTLIEKANSYRASELPSVHAEAYRDRQEADAYAQDLVATAGGEASSFEAIDAQYRKAPELMRTRLYADAMNTILDRLRSTTFLRASGERLKLLLQPGYRVPSTDQDPSPFFKTDNEQP